MSAIVLLLLATAPSQVSVRVAFDTRATTSVSAQGNADTGRAVTADDPVRIASISRLVVALGVMRLVEAGTLDLDADVSRYLGWSLRNPAFPDVPVTLRLPCSDAALSRAVVLRDAGGVVLRDDLQGKQPACPVLAPTSCDLSSYQPGSNGALFSPQGGVRISAGDLARVGQMLLRGGGGFLSRRSITVLTTPVWRYDGTNGETEGGFYCRYALAVQTLATKQPGCRDDLFRDGRARIGHAGEAYGVRSGLWLDTRRGRGAAFFASAVADDAPNGASSAFTQVEERLAGDKR